MTIHKFRRPSELPRLLIRYAIYLFGANLLLVTAFAKHAHAQKPDPHTFRINREVSEQRYDENPKNRQKFSNIKSRKKEDIKKIFQELGTIKCDKHTGISARRKTKSSRANPEYYYRKIGKEIKTSLAAKVREDVNISKIPIKNVRGQNNKSSSVTKLPRAIQRLSIDWRARRFANHENHGVLATEEYQYIVPNGDFNEMEKFYLDHRSALKRAEKAYKVDAEIIVAFLYAQTKFGAVQAGHKILDTLYTLAIYSDKPRFYINELSASAKLIVHGKIDVDAHIANEDGTIGQMNLYPTEYEQYGTDFSHDGKIDIFHDIEDIIGTTAKYLQESGWALGLKMFTRIRDLSHQVVCNSAGKRYDTGYLVSPKKNPKDGDAIIASDNYGVILKMTKSLAQATRVGAFYHRLKHQHIAHPDLVVRHAKLKHF